VPQVTLWIGWTVCLGAILGTIVAAVAGKTKPVAQASA
jgi:cytochrome c biogenesis protein CcdA